MARRGVMTALQAALAGIGGAAGGYVQMEETKRKRMVEDEERKQRQSALEAGLQAGIRSEQRDILKGGGTRIAGMGEQVAGPVPSVIPLSGVGDAFAAAEAAGGPATSRGALRQTVGESSFLLPGAAEQDESALRRSLRVTEETGAVKSRQDREAFDTTNRGNFEVYKQAYGGRGEYNPQMNYEKLLGVMGSQATLRQQLELAQMRTTGAGAGGTGGAGAPGASGGRGPLPNISGIATQLSEMSVEDVKKLRPSGIAAAVQAPLIMAESRGGIGSVLSFPASAALNVYANANEQRYAQMVRAVTDAVARASERGVLTDRDIARFQGQVSPLPGDEDETVSNKFETLKAWSKWLDSASKNYANVALRAPGESDEEYAYRMSQARKNGVDMSQLNQDIIQRGGIDPELEEDRRLWDASVTKYGLARTKRELGDRP